jgi:hypothetical protein
MAVAMKIEGLNGHISVRASSLSSRPGEIYIINKIDSKPPYGAVDAVYLTIEQAMEVSFELQKAAAVAKKLKPKPPESEVIPIGGEW